MGLFSDLFGSSSHSQTTSSTSDVTNTQLAGGNIEGPAIYGSSGVSVTVSDSGAIAAGSDLAHHAVQSATDISQAALSLGAATAAAGDEVAIAGLDHARDAYTTSMTLVGDVTKTSIAASSDLAGLAIDKVSRFASSALDSNTYIAGKALDSTAQAYSDSLASASNANAKALNAVEDIAAQVSQSSQQTTDTTVQKIVLYAVIGAAVVVLGPRLLR